MSPQGRERAAALRLLCLDPETARFELFSYTEDDIIERVDPHDHGNLDTRLDPCRRPEPNLPDRWSPIADAARRRADPEARRPRQPARARHRVRRDRRRRAALRPDGAHGRAAASRAGDRAARSPSSTRARSDRDHPLYRQYPRGLAGIAGARRRSRCLDASLLPEPIYGQVPAFAAGERGVLDLLAVDRTGRLAVIELKATADLHLPLQALDYWIRVKWHLDRGEFASFGYFPGVELRPEPPRLLLVSPSLDFHPTTETILGFFSPHVDVERIGVGVEWRKGLHVMFRLPGAQRPE